MSQPKQGVGGHLLHEANRDNPLKGKPLRFLPRSFVPTAEDGLRAAMGIPYWIRRRKRLEHHMEELERRIESTWRRTSPRQWTVVAASWDLSDINREIQDFNTFYPVERNLAMDPRTREFIELGRPWKPIARLDSAWILTRFPSSGAGNDSR